MTVLDFTQTLTAAVILGFFIGLERQLTGHLAGIRINVLVCLGTCTFVLFSKVMAAPDSTRIAAQIVSGVGFLCSGIIFKDGVNVRGLNTAATIWCTAAVGVMTSSGNLALALAATLILIGANLLLRPLAMMIHPLGVFDDREVYYRVNLVCQEDSELRVRGMVMRHFIDTPLILMNLESEDISGDKVKIEATLMCGGRRRDDIPENLMKKISAEEGISSIGWEMA